MMKVRVYGEAYECAKAERGPDFVRLYDEDGTVAASFSGINSFDGYSIEGGEWTEVVPEPTIEEIMNVLLGVTEV